MKESREADDLEAMLGAARTNWRLWTIIQADLLAPECALPVEVRSNVLSLAAFIDRQTVDFIFAPEPEKLDVLIAINREVAGGLYAVPAHADHASRAPDAGVHGTKAYSASA